MTIIRLFSRAPKIRTIPPMRAATILWILSIPLILPIPWILSILRILRIPLILRILPIPLTPPILRTRAARMSRVSSPATA